ncbi:MAG: AAA family ATPase [Opitutaceae bacterium]
MTSPTVKRVVLFGPESTGKTRLAGELASYYGEPWVPEYVRGFWDAHAGRIEAGDLGAIARGQLEAEDEAAERAQRVLFCDTDLLTNVIWADLLFPGACPSWVREEADRRCRSYALYLFCLTDLPFEPDPQRCFPDEAGRAMCLRLWRETLVGRGLLYREIAGEGDLRLKRAVAAVESVLGPG